MDSVGVDTAGCSMSPFAGFFGANGVFLDVRRRRSRTEKGFPGDTNLPVPLLIGRAVTALAADTIPTGVKDESSI